MINWKVSKADARLVTRIVDRAVQMELLTGTRQDLTMDIEAVHGNGTPLRLAELLDADSFNFTHDVIGIQRHIDRTTGTLTGHFLPRFTQRSSTAAV